MIIHALQTGTPFVIYSEQVVVYAVIVYIGQTFLIQTYYNQWQGGPRQLYLPSISYSLQITERPLVDRFEGKTVHFKDGSSSEVDAVIMCTGYLHSYPYLRYISNTSCVLDIYIYILDTLAVHHVYWISTFISISQVHQQYSMCTVIYIHIHISGTLAVQHCYLHSYPYLRYIGSKSCVLDIYVHIHILGTLAVHHVYWISTFDLMFTLAVHHVYWISSYLYFM